MRRIWVSIINLAALLSGSTLGCDFQLIQDFCVNADFHQAASTPSARLIPPSPAPVADTAVTLLLVQVCSVQSHRGPHAAADGHRQRQREQQPQSSTSLSTSKATRPPGLGAGCQHSQPPANRSFTFCFQVATGMQRGINCDIHFYGVQSPLQCHKP